MSVRIVRNGVEFIHTTVTLPKSLRDEAKSKGVSLSGFLTDTLKKHLEVTNEKTER